MLANNYFDSLTVIRFGEMQFANILNLCVCAPLRVCQGVCVCVRACVWCLQVLLFHSIEMIYPSCQSFIMLLIKLRKLYTSF